MTRALVILCGGDSTRMGSDKALLPFGNCSLIEYLVRQYEPYFSKIYLSVKQRGDYSHLNLKVREICDIYDNAGPLAGIFSTLSMIDEDRAFYISIDRPFFNPALAAYMLEQSEGYDICSIPYTKNETDAFLAAAYSKSCIKKLGKCLLFRQYSLENIKDSCAIHNISAEEVTTQYPPDIMTQFFTLDNRSSYYTALQMLYSLQGGEGFFEE